jgi:hypothetical protein
MREKWKRKRIREKDIMGRKGEREMKENMREKENENVTGSEKSER